MSISTKSICTIIFLLTINLCFGQSLINSTGATLTNSNFIFEYSIGEISTETLSPTPNFKMDYITQGIMQPSVKVTNATCEVINDSLQFFPNPVQDKIR